MAGQPRPRLLFIGPQFVSLHTGSVLRYVEVDQTVPGAVWATGALLDQVVVRAPNYPLFVDSSTVRNSIVVATGPSAVAIRSNSNSTSNSVLRNVTAIAPANGGVAVDAFAATPAGNVFIGANNVIARGGPGGASFGARTDNAGGHATIGIGSSAYPAGTLYKSGSNAGFTYGLGNLGLDPIFVDPAAGDYRQAPGSPTINAGADDFRNGELDVDGDLRANGTTDIGADEYVVPPAGGGSTGSGGAGSGGTSVCRADHAALGSRVRRREAGVDEAHDVRTVHHAAAELPGGNRWPLLRPHEAHRHTPADQLARGHHGRSRPGAVLDRRRQAGQGQGARLPCRPAAAPRRTPAEREGRQRRARWSRPVEEDRREGHDPAPPQVTRGLVGHLARSSALEDLLGEAAGKGAVGYGA